MKGITVDMTGIVFFLLLTGVVFMVGSFFITERLSPSELNKITELSKDELGRIIDGALADAKSKVEESIEGQYSKNIHLNLLLYAAFLILYVFLTYNLFIQHFSSFCN
jgi:hypothetical protein